MDEFTFLVKKFSVENNYFNTKVVLIWELAPTWIFNQFPANIWILIFFFLMSLDNTWSEYPWIVMYVLIILIAESVFQNSNVGGKLIENLCWCWFWKKYDFMIAHI